MGVIPDEVTRGMAERRDAMTGRASVIVARELLRVAEAERDRLRVLVLQLADEIEGEGMKVWAREIRAVANA